MKKLEPAIRGVPCPQCGECMGWDDTEPGPCKECEEANKDSRIAELQAEIADLKAGGKCEGCVMLAASRAAVRMLEARFHGPFDVMVGGKKVGEIPDCKYGDIICPSVCDLLKDIVIDGEWDHTECAFDLDDDGKPGPGCPRYHIPDAGKKGKK